MRLVRTSAGLLVVLLLVSAASAQERRINGKPDPLRSDRASKTSAAACLPLARRGGQAGMNFPE